MDIGIRADCNTFEQLNHREYFPKIVLYPDVTPLDYRMRRHQNRMHSIGEQKLRTVLPGRMVSESNGKEHEIWVVTMRRLTT